MEVSHSREMYTSIQITLINLLNNYFFYILIHLKIFYQFHQISYFI